MYSTKAQTWLGLCFVPFPGLSSSGDQVLGKHGHPQLGATSYHLPSPSPSISWVHSGRAISGVPCVSSGELISDCNPPGEWQPSRIPGRLCYQLLACLQIGRGCRLWGRDCPFPALVALACLSPVGDGLIHSWLALLSPLFCEWAWQCLRLGLFAG